MKDKILEAMPNPVIVYNQDWKIIELNQPAVQLLGYSSADELIGKSFKVLLPATKHYLAEALKKDLLNEHDIRKGEEMEHLRKDGGSVSLISQFSISTAGEDSQGLFIIQSGISLGKNMKSPLQAQNELRCWKILANNVSGLIMMLVDKNLTVHCSVGGEPGKQLKALQDNEAGNLMDQLPQGFEKVIKPLLEIAFEGTSVSREFMHGKDFYAVRLTPLKDYQDASLCLIVLQNITETKLVERRLKISKKEAEQANEAKSNFIAKMSHEIRTPLNAIIGFSEQLSKTKLTRKQSSFIEVLNNSSHHLLSTIDDILVLSKIESGQLEAVEEPFRLVDVIKAVNDVLELRYKSKNLEFMVQCDLNQTGVLLGDPAKLRQVLINLVNNAIKFTKKGKITLICSIQRNTPEKITWRFVVSDTGIGIAPEELQNIFRPFHQADNSLSRSYFGSGLGLTISKDLVESMGGKIGVKSRIGKGSSFFFNLTFKKAIQPYIEGDHPTSSLTGTPVHHLKVLLIDDDPVNRMLVKVILDQNKVKSVFANSGEEALKRFSPGRYNIILLDINMPGMSGIEVARRIRDLEYKTGSIPRTRIVAMTANILRKHIRKYYDAGMDDVLLKPFKEKDLLGKLVNKTVDVLISEPEETPFSGDQKSEPGNFLDELKKITKGNNEFTLLMLDAFIDNGRIMSQKMNESLEAKDYGAIGESAHRLLPSFEQLGFTQTAQHLRHIERRYLGKQNARADSIYIGQVVEEIEACIALVRQARVQFLE